jgi:hypothetical protein
LLAFSPTEKRPCKRSLRASLTAKRRRRVALTDALLAHAVVRQLDVALVVEEDVVELQVSVDDPALVQEVEGEADLG